MVGIGGTLLFTKQTSEQPNTPSPKGSVLEEDRVWVDEWYGDYRKFQVTARVQNVGGDGVLTYNAYVAPKEAVYWGVNSRDVEVYLRQGEETVIRVDFLIKPSEMTSSVCGFPPPIEIIE